MRHRPLGLGVQGLADAFLLLGLSFDCPEVRIEGGREVVQGAQRLGGGREDRRTQPSPL
jgi:hypothetical protein